MEIFTFKIRYLLAIKDVPGLLIWREVFRFKTFPQTNSELQMRSDVVPIGEVPFPATVHSTLKKEVKGRIYMAAAAGTRTYVLSFVLLTSLLVRC